LLRTIIESYRSFNIRDKGTQLREGFVDALEERNNEIAEKYMSGLSEEKIGRLYGLTQVRTHQILIKAGVETRPSNWNRKGKSETE